MLDSNLLIACICIVVASVLYLFYWNRLVGLLISLALRTFYWNQGGSSIWVEIGSFHASLLSGTIFLKDFKYHSSNQTFRFVKGYVMWKYWIRNPASEDDLAPARGVEDEKIHIIRRSCRVQVTLEGVEWFLYNRTAAYDSIVSQMNLRGDLSRPTTHSSNDGGLSMPTASFEAVPFLDRSLLFRSVRAPPALRKAFDWVRRQLPYLDPKDLLPLGIDIKKGTIICGNPATPNLLLVEFKSTDGAFGIVQPRSKFDLYKQILNFRFQRAVFRYVENEDYLGPMQEAGVEVDKRMKAQTKPSKGAPLTYSAFQRIWRSLKLYSVLFSKKRLETIKKSRTVPRSHVRGKHSIDEVSPVGPESATHEYAIERRFIEAPILELSYYADVVGDVPSREANPTYHPVSDKVDIGNGDYAPEWGIDLVVRGGIFRYGPWADRQRAELQRVFFPPTYHDAEQTVKVKPGDKRLWTDMRIFVELRDETVLDIPFREASKNWQWDGLTEIPNRPRTREAASLRLNVGDRSSINYLVPMVATSSGFEATAEIHLDSISVTSSLTDIQLVTAESCRVRCNLPSPLAWNQVREWNFAISLRQPRLYLLRDHINMFVDLGKDWSSGPPPDYYRFVPMVYRVQLEMHHYEINLNVNDLNVVDKPVVLDENALLVLHGPRLINEVSVPSNPFRPEFTDVTFNVEASNISLNLALPKWHTQSLHAPKQGHHILHVEKGSINGSFLYFSEVREDNIDRLKLSFAGRNVAFKSLGWAIRYFMVFQNNYFGSFTHFSTLFEFLDKRRRNVPAGDPIEQRYREGKSNMMQVEMDVTADGGVMIMPTGLPGYEMQTWSAGDTPANDIGTSLVLDMPELQLHLRLHDYYMEMSANIGPINGYLYKECPEKIVYPYFRRSEKEVVTIDSAHIVAHRLFGPMPRTSTYLCIWEINVGSVKGRASAQEGLLVMSVFSSFATNFTDIANAPASQFQPPSLPDVTFLQVTLDSMDLVWKADRAAIHFSVDHGLKLKSNDVGGLYHQKVTSLKVPHVSAKVLLQKSFKENRWLEAADFATDAYVDIYSAPHGWREKARRQAEFVEEQDKPTGRFHRLLSGETNTRNAHVNGLYLPQPSVSTPRMSISQAVQRSSVVYANGGGTFSASPKAELSLNSDTEAEVGITEAERNARLAQLRIYRDNEAFEDDQGSMSSGDESDNDDSTDGISSGDETDEESLKEFSHRPPFRQFERISKLYKAAYLETPSLWEKSPFYLLREGKFKPVLYGRRHSAYEDNRYRHTMSMDEAADNTFIRLKTSKGIRSKINPLLYWTSQFFFDDLSHANISPELHVDSLMSSQVDGFSERRKPRSRILFDAHLSHLDVQLLQDIAVPEQILSGSTAKTGRMSESHPSVIVLSCHVKDLRSAICVSNERRTVEMKLGSMRATLEGPYSNLMVPLSKATSLSSFFIRQLEIGLIEDSIRVQWNDLEHQISEHGPEYMIIAGKALFRSAKPVAHALDAWKAQKAAAVRSILYDIVQYSDSTAAIDPLSTIQPSYFVQSGSPQALRIRPAFRFLLHLRTALLYIPVGNRPETLLKPSTRHEPPLEMDQIILTLDKRFHLLEPEQHGIQYVPTISQFFPPPGHLPSQKTSSPFVIHFSCLQAARLSIVAIDDMNKPAGQLVFKDVFFNVRKRALCPASNGSASSSSPKPVLKQGLALSLGQTDFYVHPSMLGFMQNQLRLRKTFDKLSQKRRSEPLTKQATGRQNVEADSYDLLLELRQLRIHAMADKLTFLFGTLGLRVAANALVQHELDTPKTVNLSLFYNEVYLQARSPSTPFQYARRDLRASFSLSEGMFNGILSKQSSRSPKIKLYWHLQDIHFNVPRSAIQLYREVDEWRASFLVPIEATTKALMSEVRRPGDSSSKPFQNAILQDIQLHGNVESARISLQVMRGTWMSWHVNDTINYLDTTRGRKGQDRYMLEVQFGSQVLFVGPSFDSKDTPSDVRIRLALPKISLRATYDNVYLKAIVLVDFIRVTVKPTHWDTILAVQQKFGNDFNDLVAIIRENRSKTPSGPVASKSSSVSPGDSSFKFQTYMKMRGFRVGLKALSSTLYLECFDVGGRFSNTKELKWNVSVSDLALSLAPLAVDVYQDSFNRNLKSAFVIIDFKVSGGPNPEKGTSARNRLNLRVTKIHAVMQPSSISEVGDFVDHMQTEMMKRQDQRAMELLAFKEKTRSLIETFEFKLPDVKEVRKPTLLNNYIIDIVIENVGVAFPLTSELDVAIPTSASEESKPSSIRAFLLSIESIEFETHRGETGQATMTSFSFQFVPKFRQSVPADFLGKTHDKQTRNRLLYPSMKATLRSKTSLTSRQMWINADVSGFVLDLDPTIPDYIFSLFDVYRQGKERVEKMNLTTTISKTPSNEQPSFVDPGPFSHIESEPPQSIQTSNIFASLTFLSGKICTHHASEHLPRTHSLPLLEESLSAGKGSVEFKLPVVSVWSEYRASPPGGNGAEHEGEQGPSILVFKSTVHSSENTLSPELLPFITDLVGHVERRLKTSGSQNKESSPVVPQQNASEVQKSKNDESVGPGSSMQISFGLRIDQSKLQLTCQPDVNVIAGLHWDSGGFMINISPGAKSVSLTGNVGGLTIGLKHGFLSEDCVSLDARNLAFMISYAKVGQEDGVKSINSVSMVVQTELHGGVRFTRLQDILCFKAVWLDRIPVYSGQVASSLEPVKPEANSPVVANEDTQPFQTSILVRIRQIQLHVDLGHSISAVTFDLQNATLRTKLTEAINEVALSLEGIALNAKGNVAGRASVSNVAFKTVRRMEATMVEGDESRMLEMRLTSRALTAFLESEHQKMLHYHSEPLDIEIFDDWSQPSVDGAERPLQLSFTVSGPEILAVITVLTIPSLMRYINLFKANLEIQRQGAARESKAFQLGRSPQPDNPLSAVAEAMLQSARSRLQESGTSRTVMQYISLKLNLLRLVVFPRTIGDLEAAQATARDVQAQLHGKGETVDGVGNRDLHLFFSFFSISKFTQVGHVSISGDMMLGGKEWLAALQSNCSESSIVGLPSMDIRMVSTETPTAHGISLVYDFDSRFIRDREEEHVENIFITLNWSLYAWLTGFRKTFQIAMDNEKHKAETFFPSSPVVSSAATQRKKPEQLSLPGMGYRSDVLRSATVPQNQLAALSIPDSSARDGPKTAHVVESFRAPVALESPVGLQQSMSQEGLQLPAPPDSTPPPSSGTGTGAKTNAITYQHRTRHVERLTMRQLGDATPDLSHPFIMKKAGFSLEDSLPQYVHEYATAPLEQILEVLLKLYIRQLLAGRRTLPG